MNAGEPSSAIDTLVSFSRLLADEADVAVLPAHLAAAAMDRVGADAAAVFLVDDEGELELAELRGLEPSDLRTTRPVELDPEHLLTRGRAHFDTCHVQLIFSAGGLFGHLVLLFGPDRRPTSEQLRLAAALADLAGIALDRAHQTARLVETIAELHASREQLARTEQLRALGQMAAVVAHEVKNPLASIMSVLQVLTSRFQGDERRIMEQLLVRVADLNELVNDLLQFARPQQLVLTRVPLIPLLQDVVSALHADPKGAHVPVTLDGPPVHLRASAPMLRRALLNLVLNAAQAMEDSGHIAIRWQLEGRAAVLQVIDDGPGIPADVLDRVFEPFFTTRSRGSGLGLPIVRTAIENHGGTITVACPDAGGTVFTLRLPVYLD